MKTIRRIAEEIGTTKSAVQKRISREPLHTKLTPYITVKGVTKYIDKSGESIIKSAFGNIDGVDIGIDISMDSVDIGMDTNMDSMDTLLALVFEQQKTIQEQAKSIRELTTALEHTTSSLHVAQALHAGTMSKQLTINDGRVGMTERAQIKNGFWSRFKKNRF